MRDAATMRALILDVATQHPAVRAVVLNGSRANKDAPQDQYQDFDIVYYFDDKAAYSSRDWPSLFGEVLIMQTLEDMVFDPPGPVHGRVYLMQFKDGNRIDLTLRQIDVLHIDIKQDSLSVLWLDKDGRVKDMPSSDDRSYHVKRPDEAVVASCVNECFWVAFYVLKGVARNHLGYAQVHLDIMRRCLEGMLQWAVGIKHQFGVSTGKHGSYFARWLPSAWLDRWHATWAPAEPKAILEALETLLVLFVEVSEDVSRGLNMQNPVMRYTEAYQVIRNTLKNFLTES